MRSSLTWSSAIRPSVLSPVTVLTACATACATFRSSALNTSSSAANPTAAAATATAVAFSAFSAMTGAPPSASAAPSSASAAPSSAAAAPLSTTTHASATAILSSAPTSTPAGCHPSCLQTIICVAFALTAFCNPVQCLSDRIQRR